MNLADYFEPVDFSRFTDGNPLGKYALGPVIEKSSEKFQMMPFKNWTQSSWEFLLKTGNHRKKGLQRLIKSEMSYTGWRH